MPRIRPIPPRGSVVIPCRYLSGLHRVPPETWESKIHSWERGSGPMGALYAPMFRALNLEIQNPGFGRGLLDREVRAFSDTPANRAIIENSQEALNDFAQRWRSSFPILVHEFPDGGNDHEPSRFEGHLLKGGFHALVEDTRGQPRLLAYHASKWDTSDARAAYLELLTVIAEERHGMERDSVRLLDFRTKECLSPSHSYKALRRSLLRAADHYLRLFS